MSGVHAPTREAEHWPARGRPSGGFDGGLAVSTAIESATVADPRRELDRAVGVCRRQEIALDRLTDAMAALRDRAATLRTENRELRYELDQLRKERRSPAWQAAGQTDPQTIQRMRASRARISAASTEERRRLERDLHDGVQNELLSLMIELRLAQQDCDASPALANTLSALCARAQGALDAVREVAHGIYPPLLADAGVVEAIRARTRAPMTVSLDGTAPRSGPDAEAAVYFSCLEAIQNVARHAGRTARTTLRLRHVDGSLSLRVEDDGDGFDRSRVREGVGLTNIRNRIGALGGTVKIISTPGSGTVVAARLPWPPREPPTVAADPRSSSRPGRPLTARGAGRIAEENLSTR
jgi:signal transduction histidine kinase